MKPARIEDAPGHIWRKHATQGWECRWQARTDLIEKGFTPKSKQLFVGEAPNATEIAFIQDTCRRLQDEMLTFGRGGLPEIGKFDGTLRSLISCYQTDPDSRYRKLRYKVRVHTDGLLRRLSADHGRVPLSEITGRTVLEWHRGWTQGGVRTATGSAFVAQLRTLFTFGRSILAVEDCSRLKLVMSDLRFEGTSARKVSLSAEQANSIRYKARIHFGWDSLSMAQAFQFECTMRQKDIIGEWVPLSEPGISDVIHRGRKWMRGIRWEEIDENMVLRHVTSKKQKETEVDLKLAPMVLEELQEYCGGQPVVTVDPVTKKVTARRELLPATGPVILCEIHAYPWLETEFRRKWRKVANACGIPKNVFNMDSRSGAISEAIAAGVPLEFVRHAATHSDIAQTQQYDRIQAKATRRVMEARVLNRGKPEGTE